jgi:hypothetical protein
MAFYAELRRQGLEENEAIHGVRSGLLTEYERLLHGGVPPAWERAANERVEDRP